MWDVNNMFTHDGSGGLVQTITDTAASTNPIDLGAAGKNIAAGKKGIYLVAIATEAFATLTSLEILLETSSAENFETNKLQVDMRHYLRATMTAGQILWNQRLSVELYQRYLRLYFNVIGTTASAGKIIAGLTDGPESAQTQLDQVNV